MPPLIFGVAVLWGCQDYPFETREPVQTRAVQITEKITTVTPSDIIFVIDNSGSMVDEINALRRNLTDFFETLSESQNDYRVGFITPDIECNIPERVCPSLPNGTSQACCARVSINSLPDCMEGDDDSDGNLDYSNCDGGRFRSADGIGPDGTTIVGYDRILERPEDLDLEDWLDGVEAAVNSLSCHGSGYEAGLEALRRAVVCSLGEAEREDKGLRTVDDNGTPDDPLDDIITDACPDEKVAQLNAGFLRTGRGTDPMAELVIIFLSDEDDCSFYSDITPYRTLTNNLLADEQAAKLCSPTECYAYHGEDIDTGGTIGLMDWADRNFDPRMDCSNVKRLVNPPMPTPVDDFLADIIAAKGSVRNIRVGGIVGGVRTGSGGLDFASGACYFDPLRTDGAVSDPGPSSSCGCWSTGTNIYCDITNATGGQMTPWPLGNTYQACGGGEQTADGCQSMMAGRYLEFMQQLADRRVELSVPADVYVDSICQFDYGEALGQIVQTIFTNKCYDLGVENVEVDKIEIRYQGDVLEYVGTESGLPGWSHGQDDVTTDICLENLGNIDVDDLFEIFLVTDNQ